MRTTETLGMALAMAVAAIVLLGAGAVHAQNVVFDPDDATKAIGIRDLDVDGTPYNVDFTISTTAAVVYGEFPGDFDFDTNAEAAAAVGAVNSALNSEDVLGVGSDELPESLPLYRVGFNSFLVGEIDTVEVWEGGIPDDPEFEVWIRGFEPDQLSYNFDERVWASFTVVPEPGSALLLGLGLASLCMTGRRRKMSA